MEDSMASSLLTPTDLKAFIDQHNLLAELIELPVPTPTVEAAAKALGTEPSQIIKALLFWVVSEPVLVVASGPTRVDHRVLARHFNVGRKQVKLMGANDVQKISGYPVGAVPPFGHHGEIKTLMDEHILRSQAVYAGGGAENTLMRVSPEEIHQVTHAALLDLRQLDGDS
jgi:prolyl-tRNA editing enzyme YbaK/EbsC (Cys-tRNA(Pro) deacylase)